MRKKHLFYFLLFIPILTLSQEWDEIIRLNASDRIAGDEFGYSVAIDGDYAVVAAHQEDEDVNGENSVSNAGSVYVYKSEGGTWVQKQKLVASDRGLNDYFGRSIAIHGNYIIIGVHQEDEDENGENTLSSAGSVYIFKREGELWTQTQKLVASVRESGDAFGTSISIDGDYLVIGATGEDEDSNEENTLSSSGSAYIYRLNGEIWNLQQKITAVDRFLNGRFGFSVDIDNEYIIVSSPYIVSDENGENPYSGAGAAYIFKREGEIWAQQQKIVASDRINGDSFGWSSAISDGYAVVGAPLEDEDENGNNTFTNPGSAYIFKMEGDVWGQQQKIVAFDRGNPGVAGSNFGRNVDMNGRYIVCGSGSSLDENGENYLSSAGGAYIFRLEQDSWSFNQKIVASDRVEIANFSSESSGKKNISIAGKRILVGATGVDFVVGSGAGGTGSAYIFELDCSYVLEPEVSQSAICPGESVVLEANSEFSTINWYDSIDSETPVFTGTDFTTPELFETTSYWVEAVDVPCESGRIEVIVTVNPTPELLIEEQALEICEGTSAILTASSDGTLNWYDSEEASEPIFTGTSYETPELTETTSFWLEAQSSEGCISERQEIIVTVNPAPVLEAETTYEICSGNEASLYANSPSNVIFWYANEDDTEYLYHGNLFVTEELTEDTTFWVEAYNLSTGCTSERIEVTITVSEAISAPTAQPTQEFQEGLTLADLEVEHTGTLTWYADAQLTQELPETTLVVVGTTYYVTQSSGACESSATAILVDNFLGNSNLNSDKFAYYPNPVKDVLNFSGKELVKSVQIYDLSGKLILNQTSNSISRINISVLPKGTYVVKAQTDKGINTFKIVKN